MKATYIHGPGIDEPLMMNREGSNYFYHTDGLGSVVGLSNDLGEIEQQYLYTSFGGMTVFNKEGSEIQSVDGIKNPYGYTGREMDTESDLYYYRARYYNPQTGRFILEDPIGFDSGDTNLYRYVGNDPVNKIDPTGLSELVFNRAAGQLSIYNNQNQLVGTFPASNNAQRSSNGQFPNGTYNYSYTVNHTSDPNGPYGSNGNFVFNVPGRTGMGVHSGRASSTDRAGRSGVNYSTNGCVRTTDDATLFIRNLHRNDPVRSITVR